MTSDAPTIIQDIFTACRKIIGTGIEKGRVCYVISDEEWDLIVAYYDQPIVRINILGIMVVRWSAIKHDKA